MRVGFFGTPYLARRVLEDILSTQDIEVVFVVTNPDKPFGRDQILKASPVKEFGMEKSIPVLQPQKIRGNTEFLDIMRTYECDYFIVVAYGKILPLELLEIPKKFCINVHGSLLPKYRGASPIQAALLNGERETGVTIMQMSEGMDEGDILKMRTIPIESTETSETLFEKFANISGPTLIDTLRELDHGGVTPLPQDHTLATYCKKIEKEDGCIDWSKSSSAIYQMWQAYTPWPGIYTLYEGKRLLLEKVRMIHNGEIDTEVSSAGREIGKVIHQEDGTIGVFCGEGILFVEQLKLEGKKSQSIVDFVNGQKGFIGYKFVN